MVWHIRTVTPLDGIEAVISTGEAKAHLRVFSSDEDELVAACVRAAQDSVERHTSRLLTPRVMEYACDAFPCDGAAIMIPRDPITAVGSVAYTDAAGASIGLAADDWRWSESAPDQVLAPIAGAWPTSSGSAGSVRVGFTAGYAPTLCPPALVQAVKLLTGTFFGQREGVVASSMTEPPCGVAALCAPYRRISI